MFVWVYRRVVPERDARFLMKPMTFAITTPLINVRMNPMEYLLPANG